MKHWIVYSLPDDYLENYEYKTLLELGQVYKIGKWEGVLAADQYEDALKKVQELDQSKKYEVIPNSPKVGMPATYHVGSDSYPLTIRKVSNTGKTIWVSKDEAKCVNYDRQEYNYKIDENYDENNLTKATLRKNGVYKKVGGNYGSISIGYRKQNLDPSF